ncbi:MAG: hypothetical protein E7I50_15640, partial [Klebsiella oxytoca]|nr:hypothetical protein [Klebsiella oxytoca]
ATSRAGITAARILRFIIIYYPHLYFFMNTCHCRQYVSSIKIYGTIDDSLVSGGIFPFRTTFR